MNIETLAGLAVIGIAVSITMFAAAVIVGVHCERPKKGKHTLLAGSTDTYRKAKRQIRRSL